MVSADLFNQMPEPEAVGLLLGCCTSARWAGLVAAGRPYPDAGAVLAASDAAVAVLEEADLRDALAGHPRLGDRQVPDPAPPGGRSGGWSGREQAGVRDADAASRAELEAGNAEYERRFGHIYLACATGRSAADLAGFLRQRLGNDPGQEWRVVAGELAAINRIRLAQVIDPDHRQGGAGP